MASGGVEGSREMNVVDFAVEKGVIDNVVDENATDGGKDEGRNQILEDII